ncbi:murein L,D-transpeptidase catalytic domain-containing protein [Flavobacterium sp. 2]|uniref:murein L,D-transpeptidase catalytic domain-containing protein n=1 Tax=Flavobacterium sp. 2 TaxID=308053 RepID=UPI003CF19753
MKIFNLILFLSLSIFGNAKTISGKENWTETEAERFNNQLAEVKEKIKTCNLYNTKIAFFVDMKIKSGKNRFFVYDLENNKIIDEGLVAHGCGSETGIAGSLKFSNEPNSNATSLGLYEIRKSYTGMFGKSYKLHGLSQTNNNALKRAVVLHSYSAVPEGEQDYYIPRSHGCPMISEVFFRRLEKIIDHSKSTILLNIYY